MAHAMALRVMSMPAAKARASGHRLSAEPNVIPFIDVLLVLLIIFMVTAPVPTVDIRVDLPQGVPPQAEIVMIPTIIGLRDVAGAVEVTVDGELVEIADLGERLLARAVVNNPGMETNALFAEARILVRADQDTAYGNVVSVMDEVQQSGFAKVGIFAELASES